MKNKWGKIVFGILDVVLICYIGLAVSSFNKPLLGEKEICKKIEIHVDDNITESFLDSHDIKAILQQNNLYVLGQSFDNVNTRRIEEVLLQNELILSVLCYKSCDGKVFISVKQRMPIFHVKSIKGDDYYLDSNGGFISRAQVPVNVIVATGFISRAFAKTKLTELGNALARDPYWNEGAEQINVLPSGEIELIPRKANHVVFLGTVDDINGKLDRLNKFYKYALNKIGWNKYSYINMEFSNQIICKNVKTENNIEQ